MYAVVGRPFLIQVGIYICRGTAPLPNTLPKNVKEKTSAFFSQLRTFDFSYIFDINYSTMNFINLVYFFYWFWIEVEIGDQKAKTFVNIVLIEPW